MTPILEIQKLSHIYSPDTPFEHAALSNVDLTISRGEFVGLIGHTGSGKSTLLHLFKGTQEPDSGRVTKRGGLTFGMLDQRDPLDDDATVRAAALEGREDYEWAADNKSREIVEALLGDSATVKRLRRRGGEVWLMPENPAYDPIDGREAQILGKVKAVIREY